MSEADVLFEHRGAVGLITLNRPKALNALTHAMCVEIKARLDDWRDDDRVNCVVIQGAGEKAFCAGGDIRSLYESGKTGTPYALDFYRDEYVLDAAIKHYPKPYIALIGGIVMGGGVGVSVNGAFRIADETTTFAMPETGIGLFPDVGGSYFLSRMPGGIGMYLALTGARLKTGDCLYSGVATHFLPARKKAELLETLSGGAAVSDELFADFATEAAVPSLDARRTKIDAIFGQASIEAILAALADDETDWARDTVKTILSKSPTSTKLAFRQIREGKNLAFDDCLRMEFRMVHRVVAGHDFYEGVRATIIEKDQAPKWRPARLEDVTASEIDAYFASLGEKELKL